MSEERELSIPDNMLTRCPKRDYSMTYITDCIDCTNHRGFAERMSREDIKFHQQYINLCDFEPVKREIYEGP